MRPILQKLQKEEAIDIKEAAVVTRGASGKIAVDNLGFVGTGKGGVLGLVIGAVAISAPLAGLLVGGLIGFSRSGDRRLHCGRRQGGGHGRHSADDPGPGPAGHADRGGLCGPDADDLE